MEINRIGQFLFPQEKTIFFRSMFYVFVFYGLVSNFWTWFKVILDDPVDLTFDANDAVRPTFRRLW
jgi:hypothetical protein